MLEITPPRVVRSGVGRFSSKTAEHVVRRALLSGVGAGTVLGVGEETYGLFGL